MRKLKKLWYKLIRKKPTDMPTVKYWKYQNSVEAKVTYNEDGALIMKMTGEDYPFPGFPRGYLLFDKLSKLKHEIKNRIFNWAWQMLDEGTLAKDVAAEIKGPILDTIFELAEDTKYDQVPYKRMFLPVKEIYRAWTEVAPGERSLRLRDVLTFILQEDDGYRFRFQWLVNYFNPNRWWVRVLGKDPIEQFLRALTILEFAEVIGDMKDKQKLLRRVLAAILEDDGIKSTFMKFCKEVDWNKIKLSEADKYHFRGKYFKVDYGLFEY